MECDDLKGPEISKLIEQSLAMLEARSSLLYSTGDWNEYFHLDDADHFIAKAKVAPIANMVGSLEEDLDFLMGDLKEGVRSPNLTLRKISSYLYFLALKADFESDT